jgi:hypothetical protein
VGRGLSTVVSIVIMVASGNATAEAPVTISSQGSTITANPGEGVPNVSQETLQARSSRISVSDQHPS